MADAATCKPIEIEPRSLRGDLEAIYDANGPQLLACAIAVAGCRDRAEDAIHEAFCRLLKMRGAPRNLKAYVFRAVRNAAIDLVRADGRWVELDENIFVSGAAGPRQSAEAGEFQVRVTAALNRLSADERESVVQHIYGELTFREIAEIREVPIGTIVTWYRRGIDKLRRFLGEG